MRIYETEINFEAAWSSALNSFQIYKDSASQKDNIKQSKRFKKLIT